MDQKQLKKAHEEGLITDEQFKEKLFELATTKKVKKQKKLAVTISEEEFVKLIKNTKKDIHKIAFLLGFGSGLRISEIVGGKREDGDDIPALTKDKIDIPGRRIFISDAKGGKQRITPLAKGFKTKHLSLLPIKRSSRSVQIAFKNACRRAGLLETKPDLHFHCLRSGFVSQCLKQGVPIHQVRDMAGHSNIATTNIYAISGVEDSLKSYEDLF